ncbi:O-antigen ligase family protein [uncultured Draconibacterium sp.]|uniref:O-antigen ligase family protein n=1 Tax=uncultured Draconibacterium sp. TaxID=1573823 RepID=UPI00321633DC
MKVIFYIALFFLLAYLTIDVLIVGEGEERPVVQILAGLGLGSMLFYNFFFMKRKLAISKNWKFIRTWYYFILLFVVYYLSALVGLPSSFSSPTIRNLIITLYIFATILFIYNGTINNHLKGISLKLLLLFLLFNGIWEIMLAYTHQLERQGMEIINTSAGYVFVMILPMLMYIYKKENIWIFSISLLLTLMTGKRGALVIYVVLILYSFYSFKYLKNSFKLNWKALVFLVVIFIAYNFFVDNTFSSLQHRILNFENEKTGAIGSGRNIIWSTLIIQYLDGTVLHQIFGFGFFATRSISGFIAHNDFVEFLIDFGIFGLITWLLVLYRFHKNIKIVKQHDQYLFLMLAFCLIILGGRGLFSGTLRTDNINFSISIGYLLAIASTKINSVHE